MEKQIYDLLLNIQSDISEMKSDITNMNERLTRVEAAVNRLEVTQTEDIVSLLKTTKDRMDFDVEYINKRVTDMDKRLFALEQQAKF
ncbi:hypothetical protein Q73_08690 [Bacillus coahuilensis m2-6]|uniref:hypothetical protein n=1 Tax=Bacillus coahuilensis TaxID=408580 RepID=UPI0001850F84|nr:hypothetical protein [Bacillus coahuilensis]KUP07450.1 hypothetical protein Q73_08690 [Bacillus coahuilensis m2-6]